MRRHIALALAPESSGLHTHAAHARDLAHTYVYIHHPAAPLPSHATASVPVVMKEAEQDNDPMVIPMPMQGACDDDASSSPWKAFFGPGPASVLSTSPQKTPRTPQQSRKAQRDFGFGANDIAGPGKLPLPVSTPERASPARSEVAGPYRPFGSLGGLVMGLFSTP